MTSRVILWSAPLPIAIIFTVVTGLFVLANYNAFYFGYPFGWRLDYCPIKLPANVPVGCSSISWTGFILDVSFYTALGYGLLLFSTDARRTPPNTAP